MEQGRGQRWSLASRLPNLFEDLEWTNPHLAHTFSELSKHLSNAQGSVGSTYRAAANQVTTGLASSSPPDLVIILIASEYSCSAIIVPTSGEPRHVPLPSIALTDLRTLKDRFTRAIRQASRMNPGDLRTDLIVLLRTIWDGIMLPIVNVLEHITKLKRRSRIWLCPTAAFTSIPLHAANLFLTKADRSGKEPCLEDLYICSYTPILLALIRTRQMMKKRVHPSFVAIGQGQTGTRQGKALSAVDSKLELVRRLASATAKRTTISGDAATRAGADEVHLAAGLQFSGFKSVIGTLWEVDDAVAKHVESFYENMFKDLLMMVAWAPNRATHALKTKVPLEQKMVFIHIDTFAGQCYSRDDKLTNGYA
ncbi:hypothetical protein EV702DRAFT_1270219 [Suillus placidus]|uniref:CHAT domain-containing protein n=1 Tax=Suillus placidus TaxID=48579 RepID=A0A9P6ZPB6_9AGAM|nr:hypothetical protein EV702DRAFT_1270219 [Suillus placidus]